MSAKGFTMVEAIVATFITIFILAVCLTMFLAGRNAYMRDNVTVELQQRARFSLDRMLNEMRATNLTNIKNCDVVFGPNFCFGSCIAFQVPVVTTDDIADTIFYPDATIKWGADGNPVDYIFYIVPDVNFSAEHKNHLIRLTGPGPTLGTIGNYTVGVISDKVDILNFAFDNPNPNMISATIRVKNSSMFGEDAFTLTSKAALRNME